MKSDCYIPNLSLEIDCMQKKSPPKGGPEIKDLKTNLGYNIY